VVPVVPPALPLESPAPATKQLVVTPVPAAAPVQVAPVEVAPAQVVPSQAAPGVASPAAPASAVKAKSPAKVVPAAKKAAKPGAQTKPRERKVRKLCFKDGKLDVCP
jgi:hypothetical protein